MSDFEDLNIVHECYAPIAIPTINRISHLERCIKSLQNCKGVENSDIYISVDYPPNDRYIVGYRQVKEYLEGGLSGFKNVYIFFQEKNLGPYENSSFLLNAVFEKHNVIIFTEDDNEFSPNFLEYMNKCLLYSENDEKVMCISGYTTSKRYYEKKNNITYVPACSSWSVAYWKEKCDFLRSHVTLDYFEKIVKSRTLSKKLLLLNEERFIYLIRTVYNDCNVVYRDDGKTIANMDITNSIFFLMENLFQIQPIISKVRNCGNDGSGVNSQIDEAVILESIDASGDFDIQYDVMDDCSKKNAYQIYLESCYFPRKYVKRYVFFSAIYRILGKRISIPLYRIYLYIVNEVWGKSYIRKLYKRLRSLKNG